MEELRTIGFEAANSYVKVKTEEREEVYPNVLYPVKAGKYQADFLNGKTREKIYSYDGRKYRVGARIPKFQTSSSRSAERYSLPEYKAESVIALARHAANGDNLNVVTAVPADHYDNRSVYKDIEEALKGIHTLQVNEAPTMFTVKKVRTILQPVATVFSAALRADGGVNEPTVIQARKIVVDIGWGTTDVAIMEGLQLIDFFTIQVSMVDAYEMIEAELRQRPRLTSQGFKPFDLEAALRDDVNFEWGGVHYPCAELKEAAFKATASGIITELGNRADIESYNLALFGGGGTEALRTYLKPKLEGVNAKVVANPQGANALGCYIYGKYKK